MQIVVEVSDTQLCPVDPWKTLGRSWFVQGWQHDKIRNKAQVVPLARRLLKTWALPPMMIQEHIWRARAPSF